MKNQNNFFSIENIKNPAVMFFIILYLFTIIVVLLKDRVNAFIFIGMSIGILFLIWLIIGITADIELVDFKFRKSEWELIFGLLILMVWSVDSLRYIYLSLAQKLVHLLSILWNLLHLPQINADKWYAGFIFKKVLLLAILPIIFLKLRKNSFASMGLTKKNWKKSFMVGLIVFLAMAIPGAFYSGTAGLVLSGNLKFYQIIFGFLAGFIYDFFMAGFPEEFLFRVFIQTRFSIVLKSRVAGVIITALIFGLLHIDDIMRGNPDITLAQAFCRAFFMNTVTYGLILGVLWERTRSLVPCIFVHSAGNALNNLGLMILRFGI